MNKSSFSQPCFKLSDPDVGGFSHMRLIASGFFLIVFALDQASKYWALLHLVPGFPVAVIAGCFNWHLTFNQGAAFSFLAGAGGWQTYFLLVFALVAILAILAYLLNYTKRTPLPHLSHVLAWSALAAGALGNAVDRFYHGFVTDFISLYFKQYHFAIFNVADIAICCAVLWLLFEQYAVNTDVTAS